MKNSMLQKLLPHIVTIISFLAISAIYFQPQLSGKVMQQGDIIQNQGMSQEMREHFEETGERTLWTNAIFGGMPTYQIGLSRESNYVKIIDRVLQLGIKRPIGYFFLGMLTFYILMLSLGANPWLGLIGGIAFGLSTNTMILFEAGHATKVHTIHYLPLVAAGMVLAFKKKYWLGGALFALGMGLNLYAGHPQMTYYFGLTVLIYGIAVLVQYLKNGELIDFLKAVGVLVIGLALAAGASAVNLWTTLEYSKDTMRGDPILKNDSPQTSSSSQVEGLDWEYAMAWSNGTLDLVGTFIPGVVGGGSQEIVPSSSPLRKDANWKRLLQAYGNKAPLYWGKLPFTSGPTYFGAIMFFLFVLGLFTIKGPIKWWLGLGVLLTYLLSMGKNLEGLNRFFFELVPMYNKFRTPNSIMSVTAFLVPFLGIYGLSKLISGDIDKRTALRQLYIATGIMGGICLFFALLGGSMFDFSSAADSNYQQGGLNVSVLREARASLMSSDAWRSFFLIVLSAAAIWAFLQEKIKPWMLFTVIGVLSIFDLWSVDKRYVNQENFVNQTAAKAPFQMRAVDQQILQDPDPYYRVHDLTINSFNSAVSSYYHKTIGGNHPAKLQRYQDMIDRHIAKGNQQVLNMLNTKYFIVNNGQQQPEVRRNAGALGNAWFVGQIQNAATPNDEIDALTTLNPAEAAVVHQEFKDYVAGFAPQKNGTIQLTSYEPNDLKYKSSSTSEQFAVFSDIWYGPNKGWQAYIDGEPVEHIRANYILRAMRIPAGEHTIEFKFAPSSYKAGTTIATVSSLLIVLGFLGTMGYMAYQQIQNMPTAPEPKPISEPVTKVATRTKTTTKKRKKRK